MEEGLGPGVRRRRGQNRCGAALAGRKLKGGGGGESLQKKLWTEMMQHADESRGGFELSRCAVVLLCCCAVVLLLYWSCTQKMQVGEEG